MVLALFPLLLFRLTLVFSLFFLQTHKLNLQVTKKEVFEGGDPHLPFGLASMQGWRRTMEDAHLADVSASAPEGVFGVFDGHGGSEVAKFCQKYLASRVRAHDGFTTKKDVPRALADCFHEIDSMLASEHHAAELEAMRAPPAPPLHLVEFGSEKVEDGEMENALKEGGGEGGGEALARQCPTSTSSSSGQEALPDSDGSASASASASGSMAAELRSQSEPALAAATTTTTQRPPPPPPRPPPLNLPPPEERVVAGCTAVVAAVVERTVYVANAGDSRAVLCNGAGRARPLSVDHKPAAPAEAARIRAAGGFVSSFGGVARVNGNLSLSRAIGDLQYKGNDSLGRHEQVVTAEPDVTKTELSDGDSFLLLACDGVWDVLTNQGAADVVSRQLAAGKTPGEAAAALLDACLSPDPRATRGAGCDNMTAAVILLPTRAKAATAAPR